MARKKHQHAKNEDGFTLALVAVMLIIAAMVGATIFQKSNRDEFWIPKVETQKKLQKITDVLIAYQREYKKLPCPAPRNVQLASANHGVAPTSCAGSALYGAVPYKTLGLSREYGVDTWGNKIFYAVTQSLTSDATYMSSTGTLTVNDNGEIHTNAAFVLVSHGPDNKGAFRENGTSAPIPCGTATGGRDFENCNDNTTFFVGSVNKVSGTDHYDDHVIWKPVDTAAQNM